MRKRIALFIGLLTVLVTAVGFAAMSTGAYFSDTHSGTATAKAGYVGIDAVGTQSLDMSFTDLMPGDLGVNKTVTFKNDSSRDVKVYLRAHAVALPSGVTAPEGAKLVVWIDGSVFDGITANPGSVASIMAGSHTIAPNGTFTVNVTVALDATAGNAWMEKDISIALDVIAEQPAAPAPSAL